MRRILCIIFLTILLAHTVHLQANSISTDPNIDIILLKKVLDGKAPSEDLNKIQEKLNESEALKGQNIDEAIKKAAVAQVAVAASSAASGESKKEEKKESKPAVDNKKAEESAAAGLGALFG